MSVHVRNKQMHQEQDRQVRERLSMHLRTCGQQQVHRCADGRTTVCPDSQRKHDSLLYLIRLCPDQIFRCRLVRPAMTRAVLIRVQHRHLPSIPPPPSSDVHTALSKGSFVFLVSVLHPKMQQTGCWALSAFLNQPDSFPDSRSHFCN